MKDILRALIRLPAFCMLWLGFIILKLPTLLLGYLVVPFIWFYRRNLYADLPFWTRPWANPEDHKGGPNSKFGAAKDSLPSWWVLANGVSFKSFYRYNAIRNGANGLRSFDVLSANLFEGDIKVLTPYYVRNYEPSAARRAGKRAIGYFCYQGLKAGFKFVIVLGSKRHISMKFGWRIAPHHVVEEQFGDELMQRDIAKYSHRVSLYTNRGFASGVHPYRKG